MYDFAAKTSCRDAERAENFNNEMYARRSMMRWSDSLWHLPLRTLRLSSDIPFLQWTHVWKGKQGWKPVWSSSQTHDDN
jgi:hypothetical protein